MTPRFVDPLTDRRWRACIGYCCPADHCFEGTREVFRLDGSAAAYDSPFFFSLYPMRWKGLTTLERMFFR